MTKNKKIILAVLCFIIFFFCIGIMVLMIGNFLESSYFLVNIIPSSGSSVLLPKPLKMGTF